MRAFSLYRFMHRRIRNQRRQLRWLQKSHDEWLRVAERQASEIVRLRREAIRFSAEQRPSQQPPPMPGTVERDPF